MNDNKLVLSKEDFERQAAITEKVLEAVQNQTCNDVVQVLLGILINLFAQYPDPELASTSAAEYLKAQTISRVMALKRQAH